MGEEKERIEVAERTSLSSTLILLEASTLVVKDMMVTPSTDTLPFRIQSSATRRLHRPLRAIRLANRSVVVSSSTFCSKMCDFFGELLGGFGTGFGVDGGLGNAVSGPREMESGSITIGLDACLISVLKLLYLLDVTRSGWREPPAGLALPRRRSPLVVFLEAVAGFCVEISRTEE